MNEVMIGKDGWLFLQGGTNSPLRFYLEKTGAKELSRQWIKLLKTRAAKISKCNAKYIHLVAPNKLTIYPEHAAIDLPFYEHTPLQQLTQEAGKSPALNDILLNLSQPFKKEKHKQLYWKTDSHWTYFGCYCAYRLLCQKLEVEPNRSLLERKFVEGRLALDLGSKIDPQIIEKVRFYNTQQDSSRVFQNELVEYKEAHNRENDPGLHTGSMVIYKNKMSGNSQKLVVFGDSFSEYRPFLLTGMLAETFSEVHFIWSTAIDYNYVEKTQPDIVISEIVERFMPQIPNDSFELKRYVTEKLDNLNMATSEQASIS